MGQILPIGCVPVLPGDTVQQNTSLLVRFAPMDAPVMHPIYVRVHHFFVPNRLVWNNGTTDTNGKWEDFITGGDDGLNAEVPPTITTTGTAKDLLDYMGLPLVAGIDVNAMPVRCFNLVFNEYFRDQDLVTVRNLDDLTIPKCAWQKDYLTSARPWTQKGADVTLPIGGQAAVKGIGKANQTYTTGSQNVYETGETGVTNFTSYQNFNSGSYYTEDPDNAGFPGIYADLANATGANINEVRRAFALQRYQEARARYGSRYTEYLRYLGVTPADSRLQRPEILGGGSTPINISEVLGTFDNEGAGLKAGTMRGHGITAMRTNKYRRMIEEHGYVISVMSIRPETMYSNNIHRDWLKTTKEDWWQKELELIGQQEVYNNEVYADATTGMDTFGYNDRYHEYREHPSKAVAKFRSSLDHWHLARHFASAPALNSDFVTCNPSDRIFQAPAEDTVWTMAHNRIVARRLVTRNPSPRIL